MATSKKKQKEKKFTTKMRKKLLVVFLVVGIALFALSIVMIRINMNKGEDYSKAVYDNFTYDSRTITAKRGDITDRNGTILAYSIKVYNLILDAKVILAKEEYREPTVAALKKCFPDLDINEVNAYLDENVNAETPNSYKRMLLGLSYDEITPFNELKAEKDSNIYGVWFEEEYTRVYPYGSLAADTLGFASEQNGGEIGLESYYNSYLSGTNGRTYGYIHDNSYVSETINATNGATVVSTIDYNVQNIVEKAVRSFNEAYGSTSTSVLVMDPNNGEILAMADYPTFDLNEPRDLSSVYTQEEIDKMTDEEVVAAYYDLWSNSTVSWVYEPGSVYKPFIVSACLEEGLVHSNDVWTCDGYAIYNGATIHCHVTEGHGDLTTVGSLVYSCNDALMQMGAILGKDRYARYVHNYQFGRKTGIDLPGEEQGILINENNMMDVDLATNCFGQNINVNMVQIASAYASMVNGGTYYQPHLVKEIQNASGDTILTVEPTVVSKTISEETSEMMRQYFRAVVDANDMCYAKIPGYSVGAKSGTAQKVGREDDSYVVSFMGMMSAEKPSYLIYVVIDAPQVEEYYNSYAAQVIWRDIATQLALYYNIPMSTDDYTIDFKIKAEDENYFRVPEYNPNNQLTTPMPADMEDERTDGEDASFDQMASEDLATQYPNGADPDTLEHQNADQYTPPDNHQENGGENQ